MPARVRGWIPPRQPAARRQSPASWCVSLPSEGRSKQTFSPARSSTISRPRCNRSSLTIGFASATSPMTGARSRCSRNMADRALCPRPTATRPTSSASRAFRPPTRCSARCSTEVSSACPRCPPTCASNRTATRCADCGRRSWYRSSPAVASSATLARRVGSSAPSVRSMSSGCALSVAFWAPSSRSSPVCTGSGGGGTASICWPASRRCWGPPSTSARY